MEIFSHSQKYELIIYDLVDVDLCVVAIRRAF